MSSLLLSYSQESTNNQPTKHELSRQICRYGAVIERRAVNENQATFSDSSVVPLVCQNLSK